MVISFDSDDVGSAPSSRRDGGDGAFDGQSTFVLLGPLSIAAQGTIAPLQPSRPATLLATLLLHPNSVVSIGALVRAVWDEEPPVSAKAALHTCVQRLRRLFAKYGVPGGEIEAVSGGYRIAAQAETLDLMRFRGLAARAHAAADPRAELALLREALGLWRGPALSNVRSQVLHREEVPALDEERLSVVERVFDLEIALDRRREVLPELFTATRAHPTHEHFWEQLIESLYRTGRRAEALGSTAGSSGICASSSASIPGRLCSSLSWPCCVATEVSWRGPLGLRPARFRSGCSPRRRSSTGSKARVCCANRPAAIRCTSSYTC